MCVLLFAMKVISKLKYNKLIEMTLQTLESQLFLMMVLQ